MSGRRKRLVVGFIMAALAGCLLLSLPAETKSQQPTTGARAERRPLPELNLPDLHGNRWKLSERRGRVVLMNFWATWCPPCREETPVLVRLTQEYRRRGLETVGIALDEAGQEGLIRQFLREFRVTYPIIRPVPGSLLAQMQPLPTTLLIDRQGRLAKKYVGAITEDILREDIEALLAERASRE